MRSKPIRIVAAVLAVIVLALVGGVWLTRPELTDEQKIHRLVAQAQRAADDHNSTGLTRLISRDYMDRSGITRQQMVAMIVQWMRGGEEMLVVPEITGLQIRPPFADMSLRVRMWHGREPSGPGEQFDMAVRLRQEGRQWKVISADGYSAGQSDMMNGAD